MALRVLPVLPPLRWGEWPGSGCTVASEVAGVAWVSKEPRPTKKRAFNFYTDAPTISPDEEISARTALVRRHLLPDYFQQPICWAAPPWPQGVRRGGCGLSGGSEPRSSSSPLMNVRRSRPPYWSFTTAY